MKIFKHILFLLFFNPLSIYAGDSLGIKLDEILFFECGEKVPEKQDREYIYFSKKDARNIYVELNMTNLDYNIKDQEYTFTFVWNSPLYFGKEKFDKTFHILSNNKQPIIISGLTANWYMGRYTIQVYVNGILFAEKDFYISNYNNMEFITFQKTTQNIKELQNLPDNIKYEIINQYKTEKEFLFYHQISFSNDGKDMAYKIGEPGRQLLFLNNKQFLDYFRLEYYFDKNLKNLAISCMDIDNGIGSNCTCFNGVPLICHRLIYMFKPYISPDSKKCCCIADLRSEADFNRNDFLLIGNKKVQPDCLKDALSVRIADPVTYCINPDSTYNAVYTAKYKDAEKNSHYAIFNEEKKITKDIDGLIGIPHVSIDEKHIAYAVGQNKAWYIMIDDEIVTKTYDEIKDNIIFLSNGRDIVFQAKIGNRWYIMKNNEQISDGFSEISSIIISPDEKRIAYIARRGKGWYVMVNKQQLSEEYEHIDRDIVFSPNGEKVAYSARNGHNLAVMVNKDQISPLFTRKQFKTMYLFIDDMVFNSTSDKLAYIVTYSKKDCYQCDENDVQRNYNSNYMSFVMIDNYVISPKMYSTSLISLENGQIVYAGIDISSLVLNQVKISF